MSSRKIGLRTRRGFTLVELAVSTAIMGIVLGVVGLLQFQTREATNGSAARALADARARRAIDRVARLLTGVGLSQLSPDPTGNFGTASLTFQKPTAVSNTGVVTWSTPTKIAAVLAAGETDNGHDDNHDGLVDERDLVLTTNVGSGNQKTTTICTGVARRGLGETSNLLDDNGNGVVDEGGFNVQRTGDLLTILITIQVPTSGGRFVTSTARTSIVLHN